MPRRRGKILRWVFIALAVVIAILALTVDLVIKRAQPMLRARVVDTLSSRFKSRVDLADLSVWIADGVHVEGKGLKIFGATDPNPSAPGVQPLLDIGEFRFSAGLWDLFRVPMHVDAVFVSRMSMNIPPKADRGQIGDMHRGSGKISIAVDHFICTDTKLIINTDKPGKEPLEFDIRDLRMKDIGPGNPLLFDAMLTNPKPVGDIQSKGSFGPLNEENPRDTNVKGDYSFTHADLGTLKGIAGILSSTGQYSGTLGRIEVSGQTETPDFRIAVSGHPVPLHTDFHAIVDGTDGDTYLQPVNAKLLQSSFTARGKVVRVIGRGHDIELNVTLGQARIQDLLQLGVKTEPPIMTGTVKMTTKLSLPPGDPDVAQRLKLNGNFHIPNARFTNQKVQDRIDSLSLRSQGEAKLAQQNPDVTIPSDLRGKFVLGEGQLSFSSLQFVVPGTHASVTGQYTLDGKIFDFHGVLRLDAKLSQMTTGWKSILLKPVDPFFQKHGAGAEIPFKITGTNTEPHFGLDLHHKEDSSKTPRDEARR